MQYAKRNEAFFIFIQQFPRFYDNVFRLDWQWDRNNDNVFHSFIPSFIYSRLTPIAQQETIYGMSFFFLVKRFWFVLLNFRFSGFFRKALSDCHAVSLASPWSMTLFLQKFAYSIYDSHNFYDFISFWSPMCWVRDVKLHITQDHSLSLLAWHLIIPTWLEMER